MFDTLACMSLCSHHGLLLSLAGLRILWPLLKPSVTKMIQPSEQGVKLERVSTFDIGAGFDEKPGFLLLVCAHGLSPTRVCSHLISRAGSAPVRAAGRDERSTIQLLSF